MLTNTLDALASALQFQNALASWRSKASITLGEMRGFKYCRVVSFLRVNIIEAKLLANQTAVGQDYTMTHYIN